MYSTEIYNKIYNMDLEAYFTLRDCAADTVNRIEDDSEFCEAEHDLFHRWHRERGFTADDWRYIRGCGYEDMDFERED